jgi:hypothetical protein
MRLLFEETLTYLEPMLFLLTIFYNDTFLIIKPLIVFYMNICIYIYLSHRIMVGVIALTDALLPK